MLAGGQRHAEGTGDAERGGAAYREAPDRIDQILHCGQPEYPRALGQRGLVDDLDRAVHPVDGPHGPTLTRAWPRLNR